MNFEQHINSVIKKDNYAIEQNKAQSDREWAIKCIQMTQKEQRTLKRLKRNSEADDAQKRLDEYLKRTANIKTKFVKVDDKTWKEVRI